jgi:hypothetical protein
VTGLGDRRFDDEEELQDGVTNARVWGGIHFRSAIEDCTELGLKVTDYVLAHNFREAHD